MRKDRRQRDRRKETAAGFLRRRKFTAMGAPADSAEQRMEKK